MYEVYKPHDNFGKNVSTAEVFLYIEIAFVTE
jgi:hypothetical protein